MEEDFPGELRCAICGHRLYQIEGGALVGLRDPPPAATRLGKGELQDWVRYLRQDGFTTLEIAEVTGRARDEIKALVKRLGSPRLF